MVKHLLELELNMLNVVDRIQKPLPLSYTSLFFLSLGLSNFKKLRVVDRYEMITENLVFFESVYFITDIRFQ